MIITNSRMATSLIKERSAGEEGLRGTGNILSLNLNGRYTDVYLILLQFAQMMVGQFLDIYDTFQS